MKKFLNQLPHLHLYLSISCFIITATMLLLRFADLTVVERLTYASFCILCLHMQEEYRLPGGFIYGLNMVMGAKDPLAGPGNGVSAATVDMLTLVIWLPMLLLDCTPAFSLFLCLFGLIEAVLHTGFGLVAHHKLAAKGKDTIYFPGNATAWFLFAPVDLALLTKLISAHLLTAGQWGLIGAIMVVFIVAILVLEQFLAKVGQGVVYRTRPVEGYFKAFR